jgi:hypothetical protein
MCPGTAAPPGTLWVAVAFAIGVLCFGLVFHRIAMPIVIDRANA